jgi:hypothetical protein
MSRGFTRMGTDQNYFSRIPNEGVSVWEKLRNKMLSFMTLI